MFAHRGLPETGWISQIAAFLRCLSGAPDTAATGRILKRSGGLCGRRAGSALRGGGLRASAAQQQRARKRGGGNHDERGGAGVTGDGGLGGIVGRRGGGRRCFGSCYSYSMDIFEDFQFTKRGK